MFALASPIPVHERLPELVARARHCTPTLFRRVVEGACPSAAADDSSEARAIRRLVEAEAWTDAALALVKLELPLWTVRRLERDGGEWLCALSQHPDLSDWLDDAKEARHTELALAIISAFLESRAYPAPRRLSPLSDSEVSASTAICCENFS